MTATIGELCMGYGGLGMGLSLALGGDTRVAWAVEYDKHPSAIIAHRYPGITNYGDVKTAPWSDMEPVDWLTAGYPCQPFSNSGLRKGTDDPRHLWPDVAVAIGLLRPRHVLLENVAVHLRLGFDTVLAGLASMGYDARWGVVRASDTGAPHHRARLFVVADAQDDGHQRRGSAWGRRPRPADSGQPATDTHGSGLETDGSAVRVPTEHAVYDGAAPVWGAFGPAIQRWAAVLGRPAPPATEPGRSGERLSPRFVEWMMGLPDGWVTAVPGLPRNAQLKALGNGVCPQQAALACRLLGVGATSSAVAS